MVDAKLVAVIDSYTKAIAEALDAKGMPLNKVTIAALVYFAGIMAPATGLSNEQLGKYMVELGESFRARPDDATDLFAGMKMPTSVH